jgi:octaprenyl-diphosphate synthase
MNGGQGLALLIGDYMVFRGLKMVLDSAEGREDILLAKELANTGLSIAHGEADQLDRYLNRRSDENPMSLELYLDIIAKKTAAFFAGCAEGGAALGGADAGLRRIFREFGMNMGLLFQMLDDVMDIIGDPEVAQKSLRNNLDEGTITLPMIQAHALHPRNRALKALAAGAQISPDAQQRLYKLLASPEVLGRCRAMMDGYADAAKGWLAEMPANIYRLGLFDLLDYVESCAWGGMTAPGKAGRKRQ